MNSYFKLSSFILLLIAIVSCKQEAALSEFKYADKDYPVQCDGINTELLKEALYSFEDDITNNFVRNGKKNLSQAYSRTVNLATYGRAKYEDMVSPHTIEIFEILKEDTDLWKIEGDIKTLNYNSKFIKCLGENLEDKDLKTTFNALITTNSMSSKLFGEPLKRKSGHALRDKYLATYIALDMYYAKLFEIDLNKAKEQASKPKIETKTIKKS